MPILVRKIEKARWKPHKKHKVADIPSDAITCCLRTKANALSVWQFDHDEEEKIIDEGILALVTGPKVGHVESTDIVLL